MQTRTLINLIQKEAKNWSRENIRELIDEIHRMCLTTKPVGLMRMFATDVSGDPALSPSGGILQYSVDTAHGFVNDAWRVTEVYTTSNGIGNPEDVFCIDATKSTPAQINFFSDPGSTASGYRIRAYKQPTEISTETVEMQIPEAFHLSHIKEGVMGLIEMADSGTSNRWEKFTAVLLPDLVSKLNGTEKGLPFKVTPRGY